VPENLAITFVLPVLGETDSLRVTVETINRVAGDHLHEILIVVADRSDLETDPQVIPQFIERMQEGAWDIVAGSRWLPGGGFEGYGRMKMWLNRAFQCWLRLMYRVRLTDLTFAYRLYRREVLAGIRWEKLGFSFQLECLLKPLRLGARVAEIPCRWRSRRQGTSAGSFRQMCAYVPLALRIRLLPKSRLRIRNQPNHPQ